MSEHSLMPRATHCRALESAKAAIVRLPLALFLLLAVVSLSGCAALTTEDVKSKVAKHGIGVYINGHESVKETGAAYLTHEDFGIISVTEFDGKPFFWEQKSGMGFNGLYGAYAKHASPVGLIHESVLVICPGKHSLRLQYTHNSPDLFFPSFIYSKGECTVEFVAEKDHAYRIDPNLAKDQSGRVISWNPTITGLETNMDSKAK